MKILISESLDYNSNFIIPSEKASCHELVEKFFNQDYGDNEFAKRCNAARFIFDDVSTYTPKRVRYTNYDHEIIQELKKIKLTNSLGMPISFDELVDMICLE